MRGTTIMTRRTCALAILALSLTGAAARAQTAAEFYRGKTVRVLASFDAAGNAGLLVQMIANHLGAHLAGRPTVIAQFMPGGGGIVQANYIFNAAPQDGTTIGVLFDNLPTTQVLDPTGIRFDARGFTLIGALNKGENAAMAVRADSPAQTVAQAKSVEVVEAATGPGTTGYAVSNALNNTIGTRFKIVMGYSGGNAMLHAFEQREVSALLIDFNSFLRDSPDMINSGVMKFMFQIGDRPDPRSPDTPLLQSFAETDEQRQIFRLLSGGRRMGKAVIAPPGVPADRAAALREAFDAMAKDQSFIDDAAKIGTKIEARDWRDVAQVIRETVEIDPAVAATAARLAKGPK